MNPLRVAGVLILCCLTVISLLLMIPATVLLLMLMIMLSSGSGDASWPENMYSPRAHYGWWKITIATPFNKLVEFIKSELK